METNLNICLTVKGGGLSGQSQAILRLIKWFNFWLYIIWYLVKFATIDKISYF